MYQFIFPRTSVSSYVPTPYLMSPPPDSLVVSRNMYMYMIWSHVPRHCFASPCQPVHLPVMPGKYVVVVNGLTRGHYSVSVDCRLAYPARDIVEGAVINTRRNKQRIPVRSHCQYTRLMECFHVCFGRLSVNYMTECCICVYCRLDRYRNVGLSLLIWICPFDWASASSSSLRT